MQPTSISIFPQDFLNKIINFPKESLQNLFELCKDAALRFENRELQLLDPLVSENACHTRALILCHLSDKYHTRDGRSQWRKIIYSLERIQEKLSYLPPICPQTKQTIADYLLENALYIAMDEQVLFDIKYVVLCRLLTITKKELPVSGYMLHEKTCLEALNSLGLVHNKIKSLVASAQKDLSSMSCKFIQKHGLKYNNPTQNELLSVKQDDHRRSYLPQYQTARIILLSALDNQTPIILKVSRYMESTYHDTVTLTFLASENKKEFRCVPIAADSPKTAIVCAGVVRYSGAVESPEDYAKRLSQHSLLHILLANFAAHPQFSGSLRDTPCIYRDAGTRLSDRKAELAQEWEDFNQHVYFAKKHGCALENPELLFLNHVFCDVTANHPCPAFHGMDEPALKTEYQL